MAYRAPSYISDKDYGYRVKSLLILLSKTLLEINKIPSKISDLRSIIYHLEKTKENIFDVQNKESEVIAKEISYYLENNIKNTEAKIKEIDIDHKKLMDQKEFLLLQVNEQGVPWHNRSILIGSLGLDQFYSENTDSNNEIDNAKVATQIHNDLTKYISSDIFKIKLFESTSKIASKTKPCISAIITFSSAYQDSIKSAIKLLVEEKLCAIDPQSKLTDDFDISSVLLSFGYLFYCPELSTGKLKNIFKDIIESKDIDRTIQHIKFQVELIFLNLQDYQSSSDLLSEYVDMISQTKPVIDPLLSQNAELNCIEAYFNDKKSDVNIERLMQALERELQASQSLKQINSH